MKEQQRHTFIVFLFNSVLIFILPFVFGDLMGSNGGNIRHIYITGQHYMCTRRSRGKQRWMDEKEGGFQELL